MPEGGRTPDIDIDVEEYPNNINKVPIPGSCLIANMMVWLEVALLQAQCTDDQETGSNKNVKAVEAGR